MNLLRWMMIPFLTCNYQHHKSGATSYETLVPNVMKKVGCARNGQAKHTYMSTAYPSLIAYATDLEAELDCTICNI
jgi:hypothetical protein